MKKLIFNIFYYDGRNMSTENNDKSNKFDFRIVLSRIEAHLGKINQSQLADIVGVSQSAIAKRKKKINSQRNGLLESAKNITY